MSDEQDAAPSQPGTAVTPKAVVVFMLLPDNTFGMDLPEDEMTGRFLLAKGMFELDRYYYKRLFEKAMQQAQDNRVVQSMLGEDAKKLERRLKGLK